MNLLFVLAGTALVLGLLYARRTRRPQPRPRRLARFDAPRPAQWWRDN